MAAKENTPRPGMTVGELIAMSEADPDFVKARDAVEAERQAQVAVWRRAEEPLVRDLGQVGVSVTSVWDLVNTSTPYPKALPTLLDHLQRDYPDRVREGIARALAVRDASSGWQILMNQYATARGPDAKDGLAAALSATVTDSTLEDLIDLVRDCRHGGSRLLLLLGLKRLRKDPRARSVLEDLTSDPDLGEEAQRILGRRKS